MIIYFRLNSNTNIWSDLLIVRINLGKTLLHKFQEN